MQARYTYGPGIDDPMVMERDVNSNGTFEPTEQFIYHTDGLGSVMEMTDLNGLTVRSYLYDAFGKIATQTGTLANPYTYTGREFDAESGFLYYRARTYDPRIGRFLQEDPIGFLGGDINFYAYAGNSPVNWVDPYGLQFAVPIPIPCLTNPYCVGAILVGGAIINAMNTIKPSAVCSSSGGVEIEDECHLIDSGPTVCIYRCEASTLLN